MSSVVEIAPLVIRRLLELLKGKTLDSVYAWLGAAAHWDSLRVGDGTLGMSEARTSEFLGWKQT